MHGTSLYGIFWKQTEKKKKFPFVFLFFFLYLASVNDLLINPLFLHKQYQNELDQKPRFSLNKTCDI